jgi:hypothetical protein
MIGRFNRIISTLLAKKNALRFEINSPELIQLIPKNDTIHIEVVSFSGLNYFNDQLYSILSFYYNVGTPLKWKIYSDGTYTDKEKSIFIKIPNVEINEVDTSDFDESWIGFFENNPTLKKVAVLTRLEISTTTFFIDSDILFYPSFINHLKRFQNHNWYIQDEKSIYFDEDLLLNSSLLKHPLNFGMLILNSRPNWQIILDYITNKLLKGSISYWTDQTALHILATTAGSDFYPLNKELFVVNGSDSFKLHHDYNYNILAVRHFVGPVRHKMWQYPWKKVLGIK